MVVHDEHTRAFSYVLRNPFAEEVLAAWRKDLKELTPWQQPKLVSDSFLPRYAALFVREGCKCTYEYNNIPWEAKQMPDWLVAIESIVWKVLNGDCHTIEAPNSCVLNLY